MDARVTLRHPSFQQPTILPTTEPPSPPNHYVAQKPRPGLRFILRSVICKDWPALLQQPPSSSHSSETLIQPATTRMKDSDDYITVRAANPRTGQVSPSVGTRTSHTLDSPVEALMARPSESRRPTPSERYRPEAGSVNQERKTSVVGTAATACHPGPDSLMHMPSAQEPQPFTYPGFTAEQIEAFKHYKNKARRMSNEGYDQRVFSDCRRKTAANQHFEGCCASPLSKGHCLMTAPNFVAYRHLTSDEPRGISVRKRRNGDPRHRDEHAVRQKSAADGPASVDLSKLPAVHLVPPEFAGVPQQRPCSFGCQGVSGSNECFELRKASTETLFRSLPLIRNQSEQNTQQPPPFSLMPSLAGIIRSIGEIQIPQVSRLTDPDATTEEKIRTLKAMIPLTALMFGICTVLVMLWKLGLVVLLVVEVLLWPVILPVRLLKWAYV